MKLSPGGRPGGESTFLIGLVLAALGFWFFFDSVRLTSGHVGFFSGMIGGGRRGGGGMAQTTSMGIVLVPLFIGVLALFFDVTKRWAWGLTWIGLAILSIEIVSHFRPVFNVKTSHAILMLIMTAGGLGMMLRGYVIDRASGDGDSGSSE
tara:strand:- start:81 stop:530 length:450 start_codon:yes stop_codon:yes gene_type:complete